MGMPKQIPMIQMNLPQLARVILEGNSRGKSCAQFLLYEKMRASGNDPMVLNAVDDQGRTAAEVLAEAGKDLLSEGLPLDTFLRLVYNGATMPDGYQDIFFACADRALKVYDLMDCWVVLEENGKRMLDAEHGNLLHVLALTPRSLVDVVRTITDKSQIFMHHWQAPVFDWLREQRDSDGATPLHVAVDAILIEGDPKWISSTHFGLARLGSVVRWFVEQGGQLSCVDHQGQSVALKLTERAHMLPDPSVHLGTSVLVEIERSQLDMVAPGVKLSGRVRF